MAVQKKKIKRRSQGAKVLQQKVLNNKGTTVRHYCKLKV